MDQKIFELLEKFIDAKLERFAYAAIVAHKDLPGEEIMSLMMPIEEKLEYLRNEITGK